MEAHFICHDDSGRRFVVGMFTDTREIAWKNGLAPEDGWAPVIWKTRELAEAAARKIGGDLYVFSTTINK